MRKTLLIIGLVGAVASPSFAYANCRGPRTAGAIVGGLTGGALGASLATAPWGFAAAGMGALVGALIGHASCHYHYYREAYYYRPDTYHYAYHHHHYYHYYYRGDYERYGG